MHTLAQDTIVINTAPGVENGSIANRRTRINHHSCKCNDACPDAGMSTDRSRGVNQGDERCLGLDQFGQLKTTCFIIAYRNYDALKRLQTQEQVTRITHYWPRADKL